jgi:plasmid stability protein
MAVVTVRNLPDEVHRALRVMAAQHGRSTEAEIRRILEEAVKPPERLRMGTAMVELGRGVALSDAELAAIRGARDGTPAEPMSFE